MTQPSGNPLVQRRWNPHVVGVGIGMLSWLTFLTMDKALGTSASYVHVVGLVTSLFAPAAVSGPTASPYLLKEISEKSPMFDWQFFLVVGVFLGAFVSSRISGDRSQECVPGLWAWRFGPSKTVRYASAFLAGVLMLYGARLAGGCTSGHGISGGLQMAVSSWIFFLAMFASGVSAAFLMFGREGRQHVLD